MIVRDVLKADIKGSSLYLADNAASRKFMPKFADFNGVSKVVLVNTRTGLVRLADFTVNVTERLLELMNNSGVDYRCN